MMKSPTAKDMQSKTAQLAKAVSGMKEIPKPDDMVKLARIIDRLDRDQGFHKYYDVGVETPEEMFFGLTEKKARAVRDGHFQLTTGTVVPFAALQKIELSKIAKVLGDDFMKAVATNDSLGIDLEKFGKIASTLPRNDASLLERALHAAGALEQLPDSMDDSMSIIHGE
jgi:hypothetical protein